MKQIQKIVIAVGLLLICLNALVPPRVSADVPGRDAGRAFILSSDFGTAGETNVIVQGATKKHLEHALPDMASFWIITVAIAAGTGALVALVGVLRQKSR
ncbi:MAG: hypothetical protein ACLFV7_02285 [Phycisphaerae bacterium]